MQGLRTGLTHLFRKGGRKTGGEGRAVREACRSGAWSGPTPGKAGGYVQANLVVVPLPYAADFLLFCLQNPKACPLLDVTDPHSAAPREARALAPGSDLATDVPLFRVWRHGAVADEPASVDHLWSADAYAGAATGAAGAPVDAPPGGAPIPMQGFLLGCSFSWEDELAAAGHIPAHVAAGSNVPMFDTAVANVASGVFAGNLVVSMRPYAPADFAAVAGITGRYPGAHGAPVAYGYDGAAQLGIADVTAPDYGDAVVLPDGTEPVFWACGVTPQSALRAAGIPLAITHAPGYMFVSDITDAELCAPCEPLDGLPDVEHQ